MMEKARILIAENDAIVAKDLKGVLQDFGYDVTSIVYSGAEAVQKAEEERPDLVITEIALDSDDDGVDAASQIYSRLNIPVVFLTTISDEKTVAKAKLAEPYGFIIKPFEYELLHVTIEMALYRHSKHNHKEHERQAVTGKNTVPANHNSSEAGLRENWTRATFIVRKDQLEMIKSVAYWDRKKVKEVIEEAFQQYLAGKNLDVLKK